MARQVLDAELDDRRDDPPRDRTTPGNKGGIDWLRMLLSAGVPRLMATCCARYSSLPALEKADDGTMAFPANLTEKWLASLMRAKCAVQSVQMPGAAEASA